MLQFFCFDPDVIQNYPITPISDIKFEWLEKAREYYKKFPDKHETTSCPGIISILNRGWVQLAYQDIIIETDKKHPKSYIGYSREDQRKRRGGKYTSVYLSDHSPEQMWQFQKDWRKDTLHCMLKIQSPWFVKIPTGYSLLTMPVPYADDIRFSAATGTMRGTHYLNIQLFWHCINGREVIKAGTPLNYMMLVKDEKPAMTQTLVEDMDAFMEENFPKAYNHVNKKEPERTR